MKAPAIHGWKSLVAKIHPTVPLSTGDTHKLLALLKSTFYKHFNGIHPSVLEMPRITTEIYPHTILSDPHFNKIPNRHTLRASKVSSVSHGMSLSQLQKFSESPMIHFSKCISAGIASYEIATTCLKFEFRKVLASSDVRLHESLKLSGAGTTVLTWLHSLSHGGSLSFLKDSALRNMLIPFIIAEGKEHLIWEWMQELKTYITIQSSSTEDEIAIRNIQLNILIERFGFETGPGPGLSSAIEIFSRTAPKIFFLAGNSTLDKLIYCFIGELAQHLTVNSDSIDLLAQIINIWDTDPQYRRSLVELYRPKGPDVASALTLLREYPTANISADHVRRRQDLIFLSFKLAELLLRDGSDTALTSAIWVMNFLQAHFAAEIGSQQPKTSHAKATERRD